MTGATHRIGWTRVAAVGVMTAGLLSAPAIALCQTLKEEIVGVWRTVSIYNEEGGVKQYLYGEKPIGLTVFDRGVRHLVLV